MGIFHTENKGSGVRLGGFGAVIVYFSYLCGRIKITQVSQVLNLIGYKVLRSLRFQVLRFECTCMQYRTSSLGFAAFIAIAEKEPFN